jgi:hypothetical protein
VFIRDNSHESLGRQPGENSVGRDNKQRRVAIDLDQSWRGRRRLGFACDELLGAEESGWEEGGKEALAGSGVALRDLGIEQLSPARSCR